MVTFIKKKKKNSVSIYFGIILDGMPTMFFMGRKCVKWGGDTEARFLAREGIFFYSVSSALGSITHVPSIELHTGLYLKPLSRVPSSFAFFSYRAFVW